MEASIILIGCFTAKFENPYFIRQYLYYAVCKTAILEQFFEPTRINTADLNVIVKKVRL